MIRRTRGERMKQLLEPETFWAAPIRFESDWGSSPFMIFVYLFFVIVFHSTIVLYYSVLLMPNILLEILLVWCLVKYVFWYDTEYNFHILTREWKPHIIDLITRSMSGLVRSVSLSGKQLAVMSYLNVYERKGIRVYWYVPGKARMVHSYTRSDRLAITHTCTQTR